jgi:nicotinamide-nucleotide amidase
VAWPGWVAPSSVPPVRHLEALAGRPADRRGDAAGVMLDDLWAGLFAGVVSVMLAGALSRAGAAMAGLRPPGSILQRARFWGLTIATAESCTGGMVAAALTDVPGSSDVFDRGFVTYSNAAKMQMLGVRAETLAAHGAVSEEVAREMAEGALARRAPGWRSITGIAGPGGSETSPRAGSALAWPGPSRRDRHPQPGPQPFSRRPARLGPAE